MIEGKIQYTSKEIIQKMLDKLPDAMPSRVRPPVDGGDGTYGCVTFIDGFAFLEDGCAITSGPPEIFDDCDIVATGTVECGEWLNGPEGQFCIICVQWYVAECDGELRWTYGYNILCSFVNPQPF